MGRQPRTIGHDVTAHVVAFGNTQPRVFADDDDRVFFLELLSVVTAGRSWTCHAYCLLDTHLHLLVTTSSARLASGMRDLLGRYARAFNHRYRRRGHLFRDRHRTFPIQSERQFQASTHGILRAPIEAGIVDSAASWKWSSCRATLGIDDAGSIVNSDRVVHAFGPVPALARERLERFLASAQVTPPTAGVAWAAQFNEPRTTIIATAAGGIRQILNALGEVEGIKLCIEYGYMRREIATALGIPEALITRRLRGTAYEELGVRRPASP